MFKMCLIGNGLRVATVVPNCEKNHFTKFKIKRTILTFRKSLFLKINNEIPVPKRFS